MHLRGGARALPARRGSRRGPSEREVRAGGVAQRDCTDRALSGPGVVKREVTAPSLGVVEATLDAEGGDWDLAIFDARDGRTLAGGATGGPDEVAQGFTLGRTDLIVQACRRSGGGATARLSLGHELIDVGSGPAEVPLVRMTNFAATEPYDGAITFGKTPASKRKSRFERWTLICKNDGQRGRTRLRVDRGDAAHVDLRAICT